MLVWLPIDRDYQPVSSRTEQKYAIFLGLKSVKTLKNQSFYGDKRSSF
ncbi:MAG: hypothetical protein HC936_04345 [Leptolyngbyaceae cyanobacterium SU_3_3]|nr:hypothetical protein [Leptolyngbyaceae cyanobacterium SU_3_3]